MTWENGVQRDWDATGKADLSPVRMPAEEQAKISIGSLLINLWRMRQQDRELPYRNPRRRLLNIIDAIKVCVINAGEIDLLIAAFNRLKSSSPGTIRIVSWLPRTP